MWNVIITFTWNIITPCFSVFALGHVRSTILMSAEKIADLLQYALLFSTELIINQLHFGNHIQNIISHFSSGAAFFIFPLRSEINVDKKCTIKSWYCRHYPTIRLNVNCTKRPQKNCLIPRNFCLLFLAPFVKCLYCFCSKNRGVNLHSKHK